LHTISTYSAGRLQLRRDATRIHTIDDLCTQSKGMLNRFVLGLERKRAGVATNFHALAMVALDIEICAPTPIVSKLVRTGLDHVALVRRSDFTHDAFRIPLLHKSVKMFLAKRAVEYYCYLPDVKPRQIHGTMTNSRT
jgi:hypothetical protein